MSSEFLRPERLPKVPKAEKGKRTVQRIILNKKSASPGETLYVTLPKLGENMLFVPYSTFLKFKLVLSNAADYIVQNLAKNLVEEFTVSVGSTNVKCTQRHDLYEGYRDMVEVEEDLPLGIQSVVYIKTRRNVTGKSTDAKEIAHCGTYGGNYWIPLTHPILDEHGVFCQCGMKDDLKFELKLAREDAVVVAPDKTKDYKYTLDELRLEYTTISSEALFSRANQILDSGRTFLFEDMHLYETIPDINIETQKKLSLQILELRRCMKGVMLLFLKDYTLGARDTQEFINPLIDSVDVTINGVPNMLFSDGMERYDVWKAIQQKFEIGNHFKEKDFHSNKFALWIDLRAAVDESLHGDGIDNGKKGSGVRIETKWTGKAGTTVTCFVFVVSDAGVYIKDGRLREIRLK